VENRRGIWKSIHVSDYFWKYLESCRAYNGESDHVDGILVYTRVFTLGWLGSDCLFDQGKVRYAHLCEGGAGRRRSKNRKICRSVVLIADLPEGAVSPPEARWPVQICPPGARLSLTERQRTEIALAARIPVRMIRRNKEDREFPQNIDVRKGVEK
jgi:hypothetical protein